MRSQPNDHLPNLLDLIKTERLHAGGAAGPVRLTSGSHGELHIGWQDAETLEQRARTLALIGP